MLKTSRRSCCYSADAYWRMLLSVFVVSFAVAMGACGGTGDNETGAGPKVVLQVQAPASDFGAPVASLDYEIACDVEWNMLDREGAFMPAMRRDGTMEQVQQPATDVWRAAEEPLEGLCLLNLIARDEQDQTLCFSTETFEATNGQAAVVDTVMTCQDAPGLPGNASLAARLPGLVAGLDVQTVEFTIDCGGGGTAFFESAPEFSDEVTINGNLEVIEDPDAGGMEVWHSFFDLPPGACTMQLRARDPDGEVICLVSDGFVIVPGQTTKVELVLICSI